MKKLTASFLTLVILTAMVPAAAAKQTGDWYAVKLLTNQEIAIKIKNGPTRFGLLRSADDASLKVLLADKRSISYQETQFSRDQIEQVWRAELRFDERQVLKGAAIGAGVGAGIGAVVAAVDDPHFVLAGAVVYAVFIGGVGGIIGAFKKKGHKKENLIYSV
jgi:hypothetical protein